MLVCPSLISELIAYSRRIEVNSFSSYTIKQIKQIKETDYEFSPSLILVLAATITFVIGLAWLIRTVYNLVREGLIARRNSEKTRMSAHRGQLAERRAKVEIEKSGFEILEHHPTATVGWWIDGKWHETQITADYLVVREGVKSIIEVKSGQKARSTHRETRRQLFEYQHAFEVHSIYLFDANTNALQEIQFDAKIQQENPLIWGIIRLLCAFFGGILLSYYLSH